MVSDNAANNREAIKQIKLLYDQGQISRDKAKELAQPIIDRVNVKSLEIAKLHGKKSYTKLDFINAMRNSY